MIGAVASVEFIALDGVIDADVAAHQSQMVQMLQPVLQVAEFWTTFEACVFSDVFLLALPPCELCWLQPGI